MNVNGSSQEVRAARFPTPCATTSRFACKLTWKAKCFHSERVSLLIFQPANELASHGYPVFEREMDTSTHERVPAKS